MFSALYTSAPKVSDLRVLLVGLLDLNRPGTISAANALTGGQFSKDRWRLKQEASVVAGAGRRLTVTYLPTSLFKTLGEAITSGRATDLDISVYHCVIIVVRFDESNSEFWFNGVVVQTLAQSFGENFLKKRCLIVVIGADQFAKARNEGRVTKSFIEWCRNRGSVDEDLRAVFHGVQERWLLFDTNGPPHVLKTQLEELIDMIDRHVLGRHFYTHIKLEEVEERTQKLDSQVSELKNCVQKDTRTIEQLQKSLSKITETAHELEKQFTHVKEQVQRDQAEIEKKLQITLSKSTDRAQELENQFTHVKEQVQRDQAEIEKKLQITLSKSTDRAQELENQFTHVKEQVQRDQAEIEKKLQITLTESTDRTQELENQFTHVKEQVQRDQAEIEKKLQITLTESTDRAQELENQFIHVKEQVQRDQAEIEKKLQITLTKSTETAQELENQFTHVKEHVQTLCSEISQIKETIHDVSLQLLEIPQNLEEQLADFKQHILKENIEIQEELKTNLTKADNTSQEMGMQLKQLIQENVELKQHLQNVLLNTTETAPEVKHQLQQLRERVDELNGDVQTIKDGNGHNTQGSSLWNSITSLRSLARLQTSPRQRVVVFLLIGLLVLGLVSLVLHAPGTWVTTTTSRREITSADDGLHLRRYLDSELKETTRRLKDMDMRISELKVHVHDKPGGSDLKDSDGAAKRRLETEKQLEELREQVLNETAQQVEELRKILEEKSYGRGTNLWEMIRSLPVSLPLIISLTVTLLSLGTIPLPVPLAALFIALLGSLLILQLLLLLVLFGA